jgi:hypothetical protein
MHIEHRDVTAAAEAGLITNEQAEKLWLFWLSQQNEVVRFRFIHILYYLGGMLAISAVTLFVTNAWDNMKGYPLLILSLCLMVIGFYFTHYFLNRRLRIPAGIMASFSLALVPLVVYNIQFLLGYSPNLQYSDFHYWINWYWVSMELATILVGLIMLYFYRFPFLLFPIAIVLWYMSMDLWPLLFNMREYTYSDQALFSMFFGLIVLLFALYADFKYDNDHEDYAFWLYIVGTIIFWGGLSSQTSHSELSKFFYCLINVAMLFVSAILNRRVFTVFGVLGILAYLSHLAFSVFEDSLGFPLVLILIGIMIILAAAFFTRVENKLDQIMRPYIPAKILKKMK